MSGYALKGGPKGYPLIGVLKDMKQDPLGFMRLNVQEYGDIVPIKVMGMKMFQLNHPDLVKHVLITNSKNYVKGNNYRRFEAAIGLGLITSSGKKWKRDRQKLQPMFKREQVEGYYFDIIKSITIKYSKRWNSLFDRGEATINLSSEMLSLTTEIILKIIFGKDNLEDERVKSLLDSYCVIMDYLNTQRLFSNIDFSKLFNTKQYRHFKKELDSFERTLNELMLKYQKEEVEDKLNMLSLLVNAQKNDPEHWSDKDIRDHIITMVFAGFETTSLTMQWMWYALSENPDINDKLRSKVVDKLPCVVSGEIESLSINDISGIPYLQATVHETLRYYPPFWATTRTPLVDDDLGGYIIPAGSTVILSQMILHRHPKWWDRPNDFLPDRFIKQSVSDVKPGLYFPFSIGARKCIGYRLGEIEAMTIYSILAPLFNIDIVNKDGNFLKAGVTLKPQEPFIAKISRRDNVIYGSNEKQIDSYAV